MSGAMRFGAIVVGAALFMACVPALGQTCPDGEAEERRAGNVAAAVLAARREHRSPLETMRSECPQLAAIVERFVAQELGEDAPDPSLRPLGPKLAQAAIFAALGDPARTRHYASHAQAAGATRQELEELLYLTAVYAGAARAIEAARALLPLIAERMSEPTRQSQQPVS